MNNGASEAILQEEIIVGPSGHLPPGWRNTCGYVRHCDNRIGTFSQKGIPLSICCLLMLNNILR